MNKSYIKPLRLMRNISQRGLAKATGISAKTIWNLEHNDPESIERVKQIARLCLVLDCSIEDLVDLDEEIELLKKIAA